MAEPKCTCTCCSETYGHCGKSRRGCGFPKGLERPSSAEEWTLPPPEEWPPGEEERKRKEKEREEERLFLLQYGGQEEEPLPF